MEKADLELLQLVTSDLAYIRSHCEERSNEDTLRRLSVQMRLLLNDKKFLQAWQLLRLTPKHPAIRSRNIDADDIEGSSFALIGSDMDGPRSRATIDLVKTFDYPLSPAQLQAMTAPSDKKKPMKYWMPIHEYLEGSNIYIDGVKIKRRQIISYVSNKRGGAHLDFTRKLDQDAYRLLDTLDNSSYTGLSAGTHQLLSIAEELSDSIYTKWFESAAQQTLRIFGYRDHLRV